MKPFVDWIVLRENNEEQSFINALRQNPTDKQSWLVFADWLEEKADPRAPLVRALAGGRQSRQAKSASLAQVDSIFQSLPRQGELRNVMMRAFPVARYAMLLGSLQHPVGLDEAAEIIRLIRNSGRVYRQAIVTLRAIDQILDAHGIEDIAAGDGAPVAYYVNRGDTYDTTILYETANGRFLLTSWGDWLEINGARYGIE